MGLKKDKGIVIHSRNIGDQDRIISLLSETQPRTNYFLRGIRKSKSRPIASSEIGSYIELDFYEREGKEWRDVKEVNLIERYDSIKSSVIGLYFLSYLSEIVYHLMPEGELHSKEAKLLKLAYDEVNTNGFYYGILPFIKIRLLGYLGIVPIEFLCIDCGEDLIHKNQADIHPSTMEIHCGDCRSLERNRIHLIRFLKDCCNTRYSVIFSDVISVSILIESDQILNDFLENYMGINLKSSKEFYKMLKNELNI